ncbi:hypothetical protein [Burkholderia metallica]|uniref:hypothetical protein n=1 Tax=Burkholderia metallica TaxID=488729 RepID=UPI001CF21E52|nr:hypothetical protein [Burkholderia metallica]MCA8000943.1 hypothetical protein [Burkholderia metallica]
MDHPVPGEKLLNRLLDTLDKGISALLRPWQIRREDRARLEGRERELLIIAQAEHDVEDNVASWALPLLAWSFISERHKNPR